MGKIRYSYPSLFSAPLLPLSALYLHAPSLIRT